MYLSETRYQGGQLPQAGLPQLVQDRKQARDEFLLGAFALDVHGFAAQYTNP
jgi:hypothetical protein